MTIAATMIVCALLFGLGVFQLLLAAGAPIGQFAWGGQRRILPAALRVGSIVSAIVYGIVAVVILDRVKLASVMPEIASLFGAWVIAAIFLLSAIPNLISRSLPERYVMAPLSLLMSGLSAVAAVG